MDKFSDFFLGGTHDIRQVVAGKTHREHVGRLEVKAPLDILDHDGCSRGGERQNRNFREEFAHLNDAQERGSEIIAPLRNAVRLIDDDEFDGHLAQAFQERLGLQSLGRDIEELAVAVEAFLVRPVHLGARQTGIQIGGDSTGWVTVCVADDTEMMAEINQIRNLGLLFSCIVGVVIFIIGIVSARGITNPIAIITEIIGRVGKLDFTSTDALEQIEHKKDETGIMARAVGDMEVSLRNIVERIANTSVDLEGHALRLKDITMEIDSANAFFCSYWK